jgi:hypothetical protein
MTESSDEVSLQRAEARSLFFGMAFAAVTGLCGLYGLWSAASFTAVMALYFFIRAEALGMIAEIRALRQEIHARDSSGS